MKFKNILLILVFIFFSLGLFIYIEPSITGFVVQERFMISDVSVSAEEFDQEVKIEQFDEHEISFSNALYYFTAGVDNNEDVNYILLEFMVDSTQIRDYNQDEVYLYYYFDENWIELDKEFVKQVGRYYYYSAKADGFGLFAVAPRKKEKEVEIVTPLVNKNDILLFALLPIFSVVLLFCLLSFGFVKIIQRINYRVYLFFRKLIFGLIKLGLSFGVVVLILDLVSPKTGNVGEISFIYYVLIPVVVLVLLSDVFLNLVLWVHRLIEPNRVYRAFRNLFWLFVLALGGVVGLLVKFIPKAEGVVTRFDLIIYGLLPIIFMSLTFAVFVYLFFVLVRRVAYTK